MLALAMATITRPKLFLIDELSLGLSPIVVEQLLGAIESMRQAGTAILLVEQSMNVAVAVADRVYVMETGVVRFSGTAEELAAHPELLWSVYLEKASEAMGSPAPALAAPNGGGSGRAAIEVRGLSLSFGGNNALNDVSLHADHGEIVGIIGPNGAGKTTLFDVVSGFLRPDTGRVELAGVDVTDRTAVGPRPAGARPFLPGLAPVLRPDRARRRGRLARALHRRQRPLQRHAAPAPPGAHRGRRDGAGGRAPRPVRPGPLRRQPGERALHRLPAPRRPGGGRGPPALGRPPRRALLGRGPARGRGDGRPAAQRAGPARCDHARRRARHRVHRRAGRPPRRHGPGQPCSRAGRRATSSSRPLSARPSSARTRSPSRVRAPPRRHRPTTEVDPP